LNTKQNAKTQLRCSVEFIDVLYIQGKYTPAPHHTGVQVKLHALQSQVDYQVYTRC